MNIRPLLSTRCNPFLPDFAAKLNSGEIDPITDHVVAFYRGPGLLVTKDLRSLVEESLLGMVDLLGPQLAQGVRLDFRSGARNPVYVFLSPEPPPLIFQACNRLRGSTQPHLFNSAKAYFGPSILPLIRGLDHFDGPFEVSSLLENWASYRAEVSNA